ncbi:ABC transporter permease [Aphanothece hegewaldii CCALA 016]|uniref:Transport permease protein n=1 Tax=Aphanothece hegewaldii CCALA 016 TaxID=2107694 RepID=A0A2T1M2F2_9CHRO|nr:ABC transporter permease [Aphanothece hegewaldii]PSF38938.1 ABC transporter permease [Aphanothece hegewaldii CCALA 016]
MLGTIKDKASSFRRRLPIDEHWWTKYDLLRVLVRRDLDARYKGSVIGNLWPLLNQLSQLFIYIYVFSVVLKVKLSLHGIAGDSHLTFGLWLFAGILPWLAFSGGLAQSATSVVNQNNFVKKVVFPLALLPLVPILSIFIETSFGLAALIVAVALMIHQLPVTLALLPLIWMPQLLLTAGLGYIFAGLTVFLRDIPQTLTVILNFWFYLTPIIYPITSIPPKFRFIVNWLNPMTALSEVYRDLILVGKIQHWGEWGVLWIVSLVVFIIGFTIYRKLRPAFADVL